MRHGLSWWARLAFWRRSRPRLGHLCVVLYTRRGCHLCDDAWGVLESARQRHDFQLTAVDIDADPELARRYDTEVPVITVDGKLRFRGSVNRVLLERLLAAEATRTNPAGPSSDPDQTAHRS